MSKQLRILIIGAHADDCDICCGGLALKYLKAGHTVKFMALCNGCGGHHEMGPEEITARRRGEADEVARMTGVEYEIWDIPDCELMADLETRKRLVRSIREFRPDVVISHRPNDYHADHRNAALLVQDASYLLIVPNFCPEAPALKVMPVILYCWDRFQNPPFAPDVVINTEEVVDEKLLMFNCHESQMYEWLPFTNGILADVPEGAEARLEWLHGDRVDRSIPPEDEKVLNARPFRSQCEYDEALPAALYRDKLIERYGERGRMVHFAEAYEACPYGSPLTAKAAEELFPF